MATNLILLVWSVNLLVGIGLLTLGMAMRRRPEKVWVGIRPLREPEQVARVRSGNLKAAYGMMLLGLVETSSGAIALAAGIHPLVLAFTGLGTLLLAIVFLVVFGLLLSR